MIAFSAFCGLRRHAHRNGRLAGGCQNTRRRQARCLGALRARYDGTACSPVLARFLRPKQRRRLGDVPLERAFTTWHGVLQHVAALCRKPRLGILKYGVRRTGTVRPFAAGCRDNRPRVRRGRPAIATWHILLCDLTLFRLGKNNPSFGARTAVARDTRNGISFVTVVYFVTFGCGVISGDVTRRLTRVVRHIFRSIRLWLETYGNNVRRVARPTLGENRSEARRPGIIVGSLPFRYQIGFHQGAALWRCGGSLG
ncbi:hypothetical protein XM53_17255 [Roseovarius atlanticus]|uniref:Uncharacterized protein n=1 Tax=Roseovarius atlanticus TaxID=1641875 RepID=A0A0T5NR93_9RHOB|nr:hypothetical protein XM53_17255 [Roseovarius atlanticus]